MKNKKLLMMLLSCVLLVLGGLYILKGVELLADVDVMAMDIEKSRLYFELGFNSTSAWKRSYLYEAYVRLAGGAGLFLMGLFFIVRYKLFGRKKID